MVNGERLMAKGKASVKSLINWVNRSETAEGKPETAVPASQKPGLQTGRQGKNIKN